MCPDISEPHRYVAAVSPFYPADAMLWSVLRIHATAGCIPGHIPQYSWTYWMPMVLFETTLFTLASTQALRFLIQQGKHAPAIARILLRDSLLYFGNMLALILINLIVWSTENVSTYPI